jgi:RNA polymerase sigma factor (sigma-70 family)
MPASGSPALEELLRGQAPRVLGALARRCGDFSAAEDALQEALLAAHVEWPEAGAPANPGGWLYRVGCRRLADAQESESARKRRESQAGEARARSEADEDPGDDELMVQDDTLLLFFTCCHPALTGPSATALTLRALGGLTTAEIARAFLVPEATMAQRISRAKQTILDSGLPFALPAESERAARLESVMQVLYLMFNEGHLGSSGPSLTRVELSSEAIRLARLLRAAQPEDAEVAGLLALMLLSDARRPARTSPDGELIPLHEQDRTRWDRAAIAEGTELISHALTRGAAGIYQLQATIAALHDEAPSVAETDWPRVLALYRLLERATGNPMVSLNRIAAQAMVDGPTKALEALGELEQDARIAGHFRITVVRAHLLELAGERERAIREYRKAANGTANLPERSYLITKAARLEGTDKAAGS